MSSNVSRELAIAARLVDPTTRCRIDFSPEINWAAVLAALVDNKVPLIGLARDPAAATCPLLKLPEFERIAAEEEEAWAGYRAEYAAVRDRFLERRIESVLLKSVGLPPSFPYTSDNLDVLVRPEHLQWGREILTELGFVELRNVEEPQKLLFRKFRGGTSVSAIHLHGTVGWGVPFLDDRALWKRVRASQDDPWVLVPAPEDGFLITIAHTFYEDKRFKLLDVARVRYCAHQGTLDFSDVERIARQRGWLDGLAFCVLLYSQLEDWLYGEESIPDDVRERARRVVRSNAWLSRRLEHTLSQGDVRFPFRVSFLFSKLLYYRKIMKDPQRSHATRIGDVVRTVAWGIKLKLHISGQRGLIVSFSGIDGSGKTVHVRSLSDALKVADVKGHTYWSRFGSMAQRSGVGLPRSDKVPVSDTATSLARRRRRLRNPVVRLGWLVCNCAGLVLRYNWEVRLRHWLREVVICDRYIYDAIVEIGASLPTDPALSRWAERLLTRLCPRPDVAWLLDVPADLSVERQADENGSQAAREELSKQRSMYLTLAQRYGLNVLATDARPVETMSRIVRETLLAYYDNYHTWVNALLLSNPRQMNPQKGAR